MCSHYYTVVVHLGFLPGLQDLKLKSRSINHSCVAARIYRHPQHKAGEDLVQIQSFHCCEQSLAKFQLPAEENLRQNYLSNQTFCNAFIRSKWSDDVLQWRPTYAAYLGVTPLFSTLCISRIYQAKYGFLDFSKAKKNCTWNLFMSNVGILRIKYQWLHMEPSFHDNHLQRSI